MVWFLVAKSIVNCAVVLDVSYVIMQKLARRTLYCNSAIWPGEFKHYCLSKLKKRDTSSYQILLLFNLQMYCDGFHFIFFHEGHFIQNK